jgi:UDP-GlcNAc:undecaprenyl-phosphate GlcNAc-1-phosphate transferase
MNFYMSGFLQLAVAFIATIILIVLLRPLAIKLGITDTPGARKSHQGEIPLVGGIAIFLAIVIALLSNDLLDGGDQLIDRATLSFLSGAGLLVLVGFWDDWRGLSPLIRFIAQIAAALIMIYGAGIILLDIGNIAPSGRLISLGSLAIPFTVFVTVGMINAINMCDGLDGLSGNMTLVSLAGLGVANSLWGSAIYLQMLNVVSAAIIGFLLLNQRVFWRKKAWVFLGDAGSMMLGFALIWNAIEITHGYVPIISPAAVLWFLAVPIFDAVTMMVRRLASGHSPFQADDEHLHHLLVRMGLTVGEAIAAMCLLAATGCGVGLLLTYFSVPDFIVALIFAVTGFVYLWLIQSAWKKRKFLGRSVGDSVKVI